MTKKADREHRKAVKATTKALNAAFTEIARRTLIADSSKPPAEFSSWGVARVRAWLKLAQQAAKMARRIRPKAEDLESMRWRLGTVKDWPLEQCQQFINTKGGRA